MYLIQNDHMQELTCLASRGLIRNGSISAKITPKLKSDPFCIVLVFVCPLQPANVVALITFTRTKHEGNTREGFNGTGELNQGGITNKDRKCKAHYRSLQNKTGNIKVKPENHDEIWATSPQQRPFFTSLLF